MARCDFCGTTILFGGVKDKTLRFCNENCQQQGFVLALAEQIPYDVLAEQVVEVHQGACPRCGGPGPNDVHTSYIVWSALVVTTWNSRPQVCCRACGVKSKLGGALLSGTLGWWGFPWGVIVTPIQVIRNVIGLFSSPDPTKPSPQLVNLVKVHLAAHVLETSRQQQPNA